MIVLDTNVLSEPAKPHPNTAVVAWMAAEPEVVTTSISVGELLVGVGSMPAGRRRQAMAATVQQIIDSMWSEVLPYDGAAAVIYAGLRERSRRSGRALSAEDGMIAAICLVNRAQLATRNGRDFEHLGVPLVNPWEV